MSYTNWNISFVTFYEAFIFPGNIFLDATSISKVIGKANVCDNQAFFTLHQMNVEFRRVKQVQSFTRKTNILLRTDSLLCQLTFWRRNYYFNFSTSCI